MKYKVLVLNTTGKKLDFSKDTEYWKDHAPKMGVSLDVEYIYKDSKIPYKLHTIPVSNGVTTYAVDATDLIPKIRKEVKEGEYQEVIYLAMPGNNYRGVTPNIGVYPGTALVTLWYKKDLWKSVNHERFHAIEVLFKYKEIFVNDLMDKTFGVPYYKDSDVYSLNGNRAETIKVFKPHWNRLVEEKNSNFQLLQIAYKEMGTKEYAGSAHNPKILGWAKELGIPYYSDETAWCSLFVNWVCMKAGLPYTKKLNARSWLDVGTKVTDPKPGDIVVFWRNHPQSWEGHVGFYFASDDTNIAVLGGNQSNSVSVAIYPRSQLLAFIRL